MLDRGHHTGATQTGPAPVELSGGQTGGVTQRKSAAVTLDPGHSRTATQRAPARVEPSGNGQKQGDAHNAAAVADAFLLVMADSLDDLERARIAAENRARALAQVKGMEGTIEQQRMLEIADALRELEHRAELELKRAIRKHPLGAWVKRTVGVGEKQGARLIASIGDPGARPNPAKLWAYCGFVPGMRRQRGVRSNWNPAAKMRAYLVAESCMKQRRSPYREVYDRERAKWEGRDTTDLHKHNHALRVVAKAVLLDLWREARSA